MRSLVKAALPCSIVALIACGGGGGGGAPNVTLTVTSPARFDAQVYEGQTVPDLVIAGRLSGDVSALNGKTLYLLAVVPDTFLFTSTPAVNVDNDGLGGNIQLFGAIPPDGPATYSNTIHLHVCLDSGCGSELNVVNGAVPYSVQVKKGLSVGMASVGFSTTFGTVPDPITVSVSLPDGALSWDVKPAYGETAFGMVAAEKAQDGSDHVVFTTTELALSNTTYQDTVRIEAVTPDNQTLVRQIPVSLFTGPSGLAWAFQRPSLEVTVSQGYPALTPEVDAGVLLPNGDSDRVFYEDTAYTWPPEADAFPNKASWLYAYMLEEIASPRPAMQIYVVNLQAQVCYGSDCLPAGTYGATIHYQYMPVGGSTSDLYFPVNLVIQP
ncbi:MAG TPA: hypothetical protein VLU43_10885 [Anaeromyxobacteraceae bacterium]|nr:hypothetical protein [Anaeromyxobacteraceae bacterium]